MPCQCNQHRSSLSIFSTFCNGAGKEHKAESDVWLSPECRLLADAPGVEDFIYNGQGHRLLLPEGIQMADPIPLVVVGTGKTLILKNVKLIHAASLPACIDLASGRLQQTVPLIFVMKVWKSFLRMHMHHLQINCGLREQHGCSLLVFLS